MSATISLLAMGGTIASLAGQAGQTPQLTAGELVTGLQWPPEGVEVAARDVRRMSSRAVGPADMYQLADEVRAEVAAGAAGVVITHGTDTLEESAYALALLLDTSVPVVLTGAMRGPHTPGADGPANLAAALVCAAYPPLARYGPVVAVQDEVHLARYVTKQRSTRLAAFASPAAGPVGVVVEDRVELLTGPPPGGDRLAATAPPSARVELVWAVAGADGLLVDAVAGAVDGLVVAGTGGGHVTPALADALVRLVRAGRPVVLGSRCGGDPRTLRHTYGGAGSESHLLDAGLLAAGALAPVKARLRLLFGLSAGLSAGDLFPERR